MWRALIFLWCLLVPASALASNAVRVVTTLPDLADWVRQIGGSQVDVRSLLQGFEDPHTYEPRVGDVKALAGARVLVKVGLGLEEWLDGLLENARNSELLVVEASRGVKVLGDEEAGHEDEKDHGHRRGHDHGHPQGNPHVWLDPANAALMCRNIARALEVADPVAQDAYQKGLSAYLLRLEAALAGFREEVQTLEDRRFLSYHASWPYFARSLGLEEVGAVTRVPGQEPSAKALASLISRIREEQIRVLVTEPQLSSKIPDLLAQETGIRVVTLSTLLGTGPAPDYLGLFETNARTLIQALQESSR
ncbi:MAG: metal ABC transporter substrate-binding protein [Thermodesulfobacteriota bacterium]|jgi:ABC-type Zn uptake system ZnuABC Zn-binding protein ZnuA